MLSTVKAYENLSLHSEIAKAANELYKNGHYANAIEDAVKSLNELVRNKSSINDKDGVSLMQYVFSQTKPILKFNDRQNKSDQEEKRDLWILNSTNNCNSIPKILS